MESIFEAREIRELDRRSGDGIEVSLCWEPRTDGVYIAVVDEQATDRFQVRVDAADALDAFHHPYAYHHRREQERGLADPDRNRGRVSARGKEELR